jgi:hypothetical protein
VCLCGILDVHMCRVGQNHTFIGMYGVYTVFLAGKPPYIRSYTVQIYGSGQPYTYAQCTNVCLCGIITGKCPCTHTSCMSLYTHIMYVPVHTHHVCPCTHTPCMRASMVLANTLPAPYRVHGMHVCTVLDGLTTIHVTDSTFGKLCCKEGSDCIWMLRIGDYSFFCITFKRGYCIVS